MKAAVCARWRSNSPAMATSLRLNERVTADVAGEDPMKTLSSLIVAFFVGFAVLPALAQTTAPPLPSAPPPPPKELPPPPSGPSAAPDGQWIYTSQYGWVWMPHASDYVAPSSPGAPPYGYVYYPRVGWTWVSAPWVIGWGPVPHFTHAASHFHWFHADLFRHHGHSTRHDFGRSAHHGNLHDGGHHRSHGGHGQRHGGGHHGGGAHHR